MTFESFTFQTKCNCSKMCFIFPFVRPLCLWCFSCFAHKFSLIILQQFLPTIQHLFVRCQCDSELQSKNQSFNWSELNWIDVNCCGLHRKRISKPPIELINHQWHSSATVKWNWVLPKDNFNHLTAIYRKSKAKVERTIFIVSLLDGPRQFLLKFNSCN